MQQSVHAIADPETVWNGLEMDVAGARAQRLEDHEVDELDDRRLVGERPQVVERLVLGCHEDEVTSSRIHGVHLRPRGLALRRHDGGVDLGRGGRHEADLSVVRPAELVDHRRIDVPAGGHDQLLVREIEWKQAVLLPVPRRQPPGERMGRGGAQVRGRSTFGGWYHRLDDAAAAPALRVGSWSGQRPFALALSRLSSARA